MKHFIYFLAISTLFTSMISCKKKGCTDPSAANYNSKAKKDDGAVPMIKHPHILFLPLILSQIVMVSLR